MARVMTPIAIVAILLAGPAHTEVSLPDREKVSAAIQFKVEKFKLANGLTVLVHEDHSSPFFTFQTWFRVGSRHEQPGLTGLAHFFEHMMFKGTPKYKQGVIDRVIQANGGVLNAFTSRDFTAYYFNLPSGKLPLAVDLEADRMRNLLFDPKEIASEREVVKEERRFRLDNDIGGTLDERLWRTIFKVHPYSWPVIGSMVDLNRATVADLMEFYRIHYAPNNAVIVVVGDVDTQDVKRLIQRAYGKIPAQSLPESKPLPEPEQKAERQAIVRRPVQNPTLSVAYRTVPAGHGDMYPLDLAASILGDGQASRMYRRLVYREQTVSGVDVSSPTLGEQGLFRVDASVKPGVTSEVVLRSIGLELYKLRTQKVSERELLRAKNALLKGYVTGLRTVSGKAHSLALNEIYFGDYQVLFRDMEKYLAVSAADIQRVAEKYLRPEKRNVVRVEAEVPGETAVSASSAAPATPESSPQPPAASATNPAAAPAAAPAADPAPIVVPATTESKEGT